MTEAQELAEFAAGIAWETVPPAVADKLRVNLLHNLGMVRAGARMSLSGPGLAAAPAYDGPQSATVLHDGSRAHRDRAIIANAATLHASARDDTHLPGIVHLAVTSLPSLLAAGEELESSGTDLLCALLAAYEVGAAVGVDVGPMSSARGFRPSSVLGGIASAAGAGRLLGLTADGIASAIGLAASFGGGTGQTWIAGTDEWQYQVGVAGRNGLLAAELAAAGALAAADSLEGASGLYRAATGTTAPHDGPHELGSTWRVLEVTYKPFPICAINQMPVTTLVAMMDRFGLAAQDLVSVELRLSPSEATYPGTETYGPFAGPSGALMSAPFCLAAAAIHGTVTRAMLEAHQDEATLALAGRIAIVSDPGLTPGECVIEARTPSGPVRSTELTQSPSFDWSFEEVYRRLVDLGDERGLSADGLDQLADLLTNLERHTVRDLVRLVVGGR